MNVELKFKPGVRTSLNSSNNIRDSFSGKKTEGGVNQTRNSTAASAKENLATMTRASGNWSSSTGSILNNNAPVRSMNNRTSTSGTPASSSKTSPQQGTVRDKNYVPAQRTVKYQQTKYVFQDFGFTRGATGMTGRSEQRLLNGVYGTDSNSYSYVNAQPQMQTPTVADAATTATTVIDLVKTGKELFDVIFSKDSKASVEGGGSGGTVSQEATTLINNLKSANDSASVAEAKANMVNCVINVVQDLGTLTESYNQALEQKDTLKSDYDTKTKSVETLQSQVNTQQSIANKRTTELPNMKAAYESAQQYADSLPEEPADKKKAAQDLADQKKAQHDKLEAEIGAAEKQLETLKPQLEEAKVAQGEAKTKMDNNQKTIDEFPAKEADLNATKKALDNAITDANERLNKLEPKENKELDKLSNKPEEKLNEKEKARKKELQDIYVKRQNVPGTTIIVDGADAFTKCSDPDGTPKYMVGTEWVSQEEFIQKVNDALQKLDENIEKYKKEGNNAEVFRAETDKTVLQGMLTS